MEEVGLKETQTVATNVLAKIASICDQNNWKYSLMYGTLIGAVRHQGYIPWDDDLDIMMPREDHDALIAYIKEHQTELEPLMVFNQKENPHYPYMITRVANQKYEIVTDNEKSYGIGVFIDIYPFDGLGNTEASALKFGLQGDRWSSLCYQSTRRFCKIETTTSTFRKIIKFPVFCVAKIVGKKFFVKKLESLAQRYAYDDSKYVGCVTWLTGGRKNIFLREWFDTLIEVPFEGTMYKISAQYHEILTQFYGDYMELPPLKDRVGHHNYKVYKRSE